MELSIRRRGRSGRCQFCLRPASHLTVWG